MNIGSGMLLFHKLVALCYTSAFLSLHMQYDGLIGSNGLLPVNILVQKIMDLSGDVSNTDTFFRFGCVMAFADDLGVSVEGLTQFSIVIGFLASMCLIVLPSRFTYDNPGLVPVASILFLICFVTYSGLQLVGQTFLSFQWDILLLEVGAVCILSSYAIEATTTKWVYRFLAFKLMFMSGLVKLQAMCPTWIKLTALEYHFATQPLPTPLAWFAHTYIPPILLRVSVYATLIIEILLSFNLIMPLYSLRRVGVVSQWILQVVIALTGNYTYFNVLTFTLMIPAYVEDPVYDHKPVPQSIKTNWKKVETVIKRVVYISLPLFLAFLMHRYISIDYGMAQQLWKSGELWRGDFIEVSPLFEYKALQPLISHISPVVWIYVIVMVIFSYICQCMALVYDWKQYIDGNNKKEKNSSKDNGIYSLYILLQSCMDLVVLVACLLLICLSYTTFESLGVNVNDNMGPMLTSHMSMLRTNTQGWRLTSSYGLFRRMTGVASESGHISTLQTSPFSEITDEPKHPFYPSLVARPEILMEGYDSLSQAWQPIRFTYKPDDVVVAPRFVAPLQPRLDWQMWFAALGHYSHQPYLIHLIYKILQGKSTKHLWHLLDYERNAAVWRNGANVPKAIRLQLYDYDFTRTDTAWNRALCAASNRTRILLSEEDKDWWVRSNGRVYLGEIDATNPSVEQYLVSSNLQPLREHKDSNTLYEECITSRKINTMAAMVICPAIQVRNMFGGTL
jgi:hypothetical protein